jgi:hypothetical protein
MYVGLLILVWRLYWTVRVEVRTAENVEPSGIGDIVGFINLVLVEFDGPFVFA